MKKNIKFGIVIATLCFLFVTIGCFHTVSAITLMDSSSTLGDLINDILILLNSGVPLLIGLAVIVFLYGVLLFIAKASAGNAEGRKEGINFMIFGIIGIAVMVSVWGLVAFVTNTFGTTNGIPQFNTARTGQNYRSDDIFPSY